jgi:hypothetical protein
MGVHVKRLVFLATAIASAMVLVAPVAGGSAWSNGEVGTASSGSATFVMALSRSADKSNGVITTQSTADEATQGPAPDDGHSTTKPLVKKSVSRGASSTAAARRAATKASTRACPSAVSGATGSAPSATSKGGVQGTTTADLAGFAAKMNAIRVAHCLAPIPMANFHYDSCMEQRLFWMAEDPSTNPMSAWGHIGSKRSDGVPSVGCDGNLAGGSGNTGATVAQKWWDSSTHRSVEYRPSYARRHPERADLVHARRFSLDDLLIVTG